MVEPELTGEKAKTPETVEPKAAQWLRLLKLGETYNEDGEWIGDMKLVKSSTDIPIDNPKTGKPVVHPDTEQPLRLKEVDRVCPDHAAMIFYLLEQLPEDDPDYIDAFEQGMEAVEFWSQGTDILPLIQAHVLEQQAN